MTQQVLHGGSLRTTLSVHHDGRRSRGEHGGGSTWRHDRFNLLQVVAEHLRLLTVLASSSLARDLVLLLFVAYSLYLREASHMLITLHLCFGQSDLPGTAVVVKDALVTVRYALSVFCERSLAMLMLLLAFSTGRVEPAALSIIVHGLPHSVFFDLCFL